MQIYTVYQYSCLSVESPETQGDIQGIIFILISYSSSLPFACFTPRFHVFQFSPSFSVYFFLRLSLHFLYLVKFDKCRLWVVPDHFIPLRTVTCRFHYWNTVCDMFYCSILTCSLTYEIPSMVNVLPNNQVTYSDHNRKFSYFFFHQSCRKRIKYLQVFRVINSKIQTCQRIH